MANSPAFHVIRAAILLLPLFSRAADPPAFHAEEVRRTAADLASPDPETRERAYQAFLDWGASNPEEALRALPGPTEDPDLEARLSRLRVHIPAEKTRRQLLDLLSSDASLRKMGEEIWETPQGPALMALFHELGRLDGGYQTPTAQERRRKIVRCLARHPEIDTSFKMILTMTVSSDPGPPEETEIRLFLDLLEANEPSIRMPVLHGLHRLLERSENLPSLRASPLADRLAAIVAKPQREFAPGIDLRGEAAFLLVSLSGPPAVPQVAGLLDHPQSMVRARVGQALGSLKLESLRPSLQKLLTDNDPICKRTAAIALARLGPVDPVEVEAALRALILEKAGGAPPAYSLHLAVDNDEPYFACTIFRRDPELEEEIARTAKGLKVTYTAPQEQHAETDGETDLEEIEDPDE